MLLVIAVVSTTVLFIGALRAQAPQTRSILPPTSIKPTPTTTVARATPTPDSRDPVSYGWTFVAPADFADTQFATSSALQGYLCGASETGDANIFGTTTDGGNTWHLADSPALYATCFLQISATNPLDITLTSYNEPGDGNTVYVEAHYSSDGGQTWQKAPIPQQTVGSGGAMWVGSSLYVYLHSGTQSTLQVSDKGGPFTPIDVDTLLPGAHNSTILGAVASGTRLYLNLSRSDCSTSTCISVVASADGGQTWTQIPNQPNIEVEAVSGNTLFGTSADDQPFITAIYSSQDNGATWSTTTLPPLTGSQGIQSFVISPDRSILVSSTAGVSLLRGGAWTTIPVSSNPGETIKVTAVSLGADSRPQKIWGYDGDTHIGVFWHTMP